MKALCLQAQPWTLRITFKAFCGRAGCVQCCGWGLYNLAALGNYKDKWREAQSITHPVRERGLRLGNCVFESSPHPPWLLSFTLFLLFACILVFVFLLVFFIVFFSISVYSLLASLSLSLSPSSFTDPEVWKCSFTLPLLHKLLFYFLQLQIVLPAHFKWNKRVSRFCGNNLFHVLFGRLLCWPSSSQSVRKKNGNSSIWVLISCELPELFCVCSQRLLNHCLFLFFFTNCSLSHHFTSFLSPFYMSFFFLYLSYFFSPPFFSVSFQ